MINPITPRTNQSEVFFRKWALNKSPGRKLEITVARNFNEIIIK